MAVVGFRLWLSRTEGFYSRRAAGLRPAAAARGGRLVSSFSRAPDPACAPVPPKEHVELCGMAVVRHGSGRKPSCSAPPLATRAAACLAACSSTSPGASRAGSATGSCEAPAQHTHSTRSAHTHPFRARTAHAQHTLGTRSAKPIHWGQQGGEGRGTTVCGPGKSKSVCCMTHRQVCRGGGGATVRGHRAAADGLLEACGRWLSVRLLLPPFSIL